MCVHEINISMSITYKVITEAGSVPSTEAAAAAALTTLAVWTILDFQTTNGLLAQTHLQSFSPLLPLLGMARIICVCTNTRTHCIPPRHRVTINHHPRCRPPPALLYHQPNRRLHYADGYTQQFKNHTRHSVVARRISSLGLPQKQPPSIDMLPSTPARTHMSIFPTEVLF